MPRQKRSAATGALLFGLAAGAIVPIPASAAPSSPCLRPATTTVATLGVWDPLNNRGRNAGHDSEVSGVATGLGRPDTSRGASVVPAARVQPRQGRIRRILLCRGSRLLARLPVPADRRSRIVGLSVNGRRIAWRLAGSNGRGSLRVGTVRRGRVVGIRRTSSRALDRARHYDGRIVVMPDGGAAWSLRQGRKAGVWLWPAGERPRRIALAAPITASWDVRIVGRHHVLMGAAKRIARYGPRTPGRCPTPQLAPHHDLGPVRIVQVPSASIEYASSGWSALLICDRSVGDYVRLLDYTFEDVGDGSGHTTDSSEPSDVTVTGRTVLVRSTGSSYWAGGAFESYSSGTTVLPLDSRRSFLTARVASVGSGAGPGSPAGDPSWAIAPGAVAWAGDRPPALGAERSTREIWLADGLGPRLVGSYSIAVGLQPKPEENPAFELSETSLTWTAGTVRRSVPVTPDVNTAIDRVTLP